MTGRAKAKADPTRARRRGGAKAPPRRRALAAGQLKHSSRPTRRRAGAKAPARRRV